MKSLLRGMFALALLSQCTSVYADPKPILVLTEWIDWGGIGHPWPIEVRLVAYDNGLIIRQPERNDPRKRPNFVWQQRTPAEAYALAAEAKAAALDGLQTTDETVPLPLHVGWTDIEYWDAEKAASTRVTAYGMPCGAKNKDAEDEIVALMRSVTHPRFLELCDALLGLELKDAREWHPQEMVVTLLSTTSAPTRSSHGPAIGRKSGGRSTSRTTRKSRYAFPSARNLNL